MEKTSLPWRAVLIFSLISSNAFAQTPASQNAPASSVLYSAKDAETFASDILALSGVPMASEQQRGALMALSRWAQANPTQAIQLRWALESNQVSEAEKKRLIELALQNAPQDPFTPDTKDFSALNDLGQALQRLPSAAVLEGKQSLDHFFDNAEVDSGASLAVVLPKASPAEIGRDARWVARTFRQGSGFEPPVRKDAWQIRAQDLREQVLVSAGLWPLPEKTPLRPVVTGRIEREDYSIEKVHFQSHPGFYVTGNLYRPAGKQGPLPGVLLAQGHWDEMARLGRKNLLSALKEVVIGREEHLRAARYPMQALAANLAKSGIVVFQYDMVGYGDSRQIGHGFGTFSDPEKSLNSQSLFGLQTWNTMRSLDFLLSLPEVDPERIGATGASGGGTQTLMLMATDDRLKVAAPVCMISAGYHQGGCECENAPGLRVGTDNVELSGTFAPKPFLHVTATRDWTKRFLKKGLPELKSLYRFFGAEDDVQAVRYRSPHNFNLRSREAVYDWFNRRFRLGAAQPIHEKDFEPVDPHELVVFDDSHPRPHDAASESVLKSYLLGSSQKQLEALRPQDARSLANFQSVVGAGLRHLVASDLPAAEEVMGWETETRRGGGLRVRKIVLARKRGGERIPARLYMPQNSKGTAAVLVHPKGAAALEDGSGRPAGLLAGLLSDGQIVLVPDVLGTGEHIPPPDLQGVSNPSDGYYLGYNRSPLANRVHDILTAVAFLKGTPGVRQVQLVGLEAAGPACLLARGLSGVAIARAACDGDQFDFEQVHELTHPNYLPGALRFGGLWPFAALAAPAELFVYNARTSERQAWLRDAYSAAGASGRLRLEPEKPEAGTLLAWLSRPI